MIEKLVVAKTKVMTYTLTTRITESPRKNNLAMNLSLEELFMTFPLLFFVTSVQSSFTSSRIKLQCLSNALIFASSL